MFITPPVCIYVALPYTTVCLSHPLIYIALPYTTVCLSHPLYIYCITVYDGVFITPPWGDFPWSISPQLGYNNSVGAKKVGVRNISSRAFRRRIVRYWHYWHSLGCRAIDLGKPPQGGVICDTHRRIRQPLYDLKACLKLSKTGAITSSVTRTEAAHMYRTTPYMLYCWGRGRTYPRYSSSIPYMSRIFPTRARNMILCFVPGILGSRADVRSDCRIQLYPNIMIICTQCSCTNDPNISDQSSVPKYKDRFDSILMYNVQSLCFGPVLCREKRTIRNQC